MFIFDEFPSLHEEVVEAAYQAMAEFRHVRRQFTRRRSTLAVEEKSFK